MVDDVGLRAFIRAAVVVSAEVDVHHPILEFLPGQGQRMTAAVTKQQPTKQIFSPHPGRTAMSCPDFCAAGEGDRGDGLNVKNAEPSTTRRFLSSIAYAI